MSKKEPKRKRRLLTGEQLLAGFALLVILSLLITPLVTLDLPPPPTFTPRLIPTDLPTAVPSETATPTATPTGSAPASPTPGQAPAPPSP